MTKFPPPRTACRKNRVSVLGFPGRSQCRNSSSSRSLGLPLVSKESKRDAASFPMRQRSRLQGRDRCRSANNHHDPTTAARLRRRIALDALPDCTFISASHTRRSRISFAPVSMDPSTIRERPVLLSDRVIPMLPGGFSNHCAL